MKIALNRLLRDVIMNARSANVEDRQQIFIISSHKQTKLSRSIEFSAMFVNIGVLPEVLRNENEIAMLL
jgi:hypothetical protein